MITMPVRFDRPGVAVNLSVSMRIRTPPLQPAHGRIASGRLEAVSAAIMTLISTRHQHW